MTARFRLAALFAVSFFGVAHAQIRENFIDITTYTGLQIIQGPDPRHFVVCLGLNAHAVIEGEDMSIGCISGFYVISDIGDLNATGVNWNNWDFYKTFKDVAGWNGFDDPTPIMPGECFTFEFNTLNSPAITRCGLRVTVPGGVPKFVALPCEVPEPSQVAGVVAAVGCVAALGWRRRR